MTSLQGNPTLDPVLLAAEKARDPERYAREIEAEWLDSASALLPGEAIDRSIVKDRYENLPVKGTRVILGIDAAFRSDSFAAVWSHVEEDKVVVDCARVWSPKSGKPVKFASTMDSIIETSIYYGCRRAFAGQVSNEVIKQRLADAGITLEQVSTGGRRSGGIYQALRAKCLAGQLELLDHPELLSQLRRLEVTRSSGGGERVEASSGHDDLAVACALSVFESLSQRKTGKPFIETIRVGVTATSERGWTNL